VTVKQGSNYKWLVFFSVGLGTFMSVVDHGSVNIALPTIATHFKADLPTVQWVALGYALAISAFLLPAGRMADQFGRKESYIAGFVIFGVGSAAAGMAPNLWSLITLKILTAAGSALVMANGMAIMTSVFPAAERGKAVGTHMTIVGSGSIFGPVLGGVLVEALGWRSVFFINVPIAMLGVASSLVILDAKSLAQASKDGRKGSFDWLGAGLSAGALVIFLTAMTSGHEAGWGSPVIVTGLAAAAGLMAGFIWWQTKARSPMLELALFRNRTFSIGATAGFISFLSGSSVWFLMPFYLQKVLGYNPGATGLIMVASAASMAVMGPIAGRLSDRYGHKIFNVSGALMISAGLFMVTRLTEASSLGLVVPALVMHGLGNGMFQASNHSSMLGAVEPKRYGVASAFVNLNRNTASVTGIAIATTIVVVTMGNMGYEPSLDAVSEGGGVGVAHAFTVGLQRAYMMAGVVMLVGMVLTLFKGKQEEPTGKAAVAPVAGEKTAEAHGTSD